MMSTSMQYRGLASSLLQHLQRRKSRPLLEPPSPYFLSKSPLSSSSGSSISSSSGGVGGSRRVNVAVVGSGPSGFYSVKYLLDKQVQTHSCGEVHVDLIDKMPVPFGLVRFGVAPDHQDVKAVANTFKEVAKNPRFRFFGNITVGSGQNDISVDKLLSHYDAVILATGASSDNRLNIPGEDSIGVFAARSFVNWYNSHPDFNHVMDPIDLKKVTDVVIIGQGNVAIDCARVIIKGKDLSLRESDVSSVAEKALFQAAVKRISMIGRRGHIQSSFTIKEFRELSKLSNSVLNIKKDEIEAGRNAASLKELEDTRGKVRITELIESFASGSATAIGEDNKRIDMDIRFLWSPIAIHKDEATGAVQSVRMQKSKLVGSPHSQKVEGLQEFIDVPCQLVLKSVGYQCESIEGVPFSKKTNTIPHNKGRVMTPDGNAFPKLYVTGWTKRGPTGIVGTNIPDAKETVTSVLEDISTNIITPEQHQHDDIASKSDPATSIGGLMASETIISWSEFLRIDDEETSKGSESSPPRVRVKFNNVPDMFKTAKGKP